MKKFLIVFLIIFGISLTSCNNSRTGTFTRFDTIVEFDGYDSYEIFQVLYETEGLASWLGNANDLHSIVYIVSDKPIYNGIRISENEKQEFKMVGTFRYETVCGEILVVPVIMLLDKKVVMTTSI